MSEGEPPFNPMRMYAATRRLGTAHGVSSCATTAYGVALLSNASRLITDGARGQQLRRELASYRARHGELNCSSLPPVPPVPPRPPHDANREARRAAARPRPGPSAARKGRSRAAIWQSPPPERA